MLSRLGFLVSETNQRLRPDGHAAESLGKGATWKSMALELSPLALAAGGSKELGGAIGSASTSESVDALAWVWSCCWLAMFGKAKKSGKELGGGVCGL